MNFNLAVILRETASAAPGRPAALYSGGKLSYGELDMLSDRLAAGLEAAGVRPGEPVGLQLPNIPQFLIAYFGILKCGAVAVPLNVMLKAPELAFQLGDCAARLLITWEGVLGDAAKGAEAAGVDAVYAVGHPAECRGRDRAVRAAARHSRARLPAGPPGPDRHCRRRLHGGHHRPPQGRHADATSSCT